MSAVEPPVERMPVERVELTVQSRQDQPSLSERHRYREALEQGEKLARLKRDRGKRRENRIREPREQQVQTWIKTLDHKIRWYILQFHTNNSVEKVIDEITNHLSHDTLAFERLRTKAMYMVKNIKHRTTNSLQAHVKAILMGENGHLLKECSKTAFAKLFNAENYQERFPYIKDYVYVDKSTEMGKYYMKVMYVNLCIAIRPLAILT
jgi:hypothetical protein